MKIVVNCISELDDLSKIILNNRKNRDIICFYGEMGVGKTTLIKVICKELGIKDNVSSPTFSIVNEYISSLGDSVYHFDFYRIKDEEEALDMGYEEYFFKNSLCFVEWPEKVSSLIPDEAMKIKITKNKESRIIEIL
ncbi:MAG: tRNA (adenosine(37)-N6)-threonylcarbamoyltransferase complex ATPase subunit type 1 TsaE [Flavobacteriales bacterium]|nr:tRNA (adenosine(37)-N6)-threonylcarbamoyltransferase complex ATPase subunit type 1 TsaE [Flavobacteriales bacterium]|tara:strand:- start:4450 stop:4860 length:411 start_codon:yes stop_codon:yes gene_type:complete